jgi:hypothetical protein
MHPEEEDGLTRGPGVSARWGKASVPILGCLRMGHGPNLARASSVSRGLLSLFFVLYFSFSVFSFLSYLLQKCFKSSQTNF